MQNTLLLHKPLLSGKLVVMRNTWGNALQTHRELLHCIGDSDRCLALDMNGEIVIRGRSTMEKTAGFSSQ